MGIDFWGKITTLIMSLNWSSINTGIIAFVLALILKSLLDFKIAYFFVKYLNFLPVRNIFREKPPSLNGTWEIEWGSGGSSKYDADIDRHGHTNLKQLGSYIYFEFYSQKIKYAFFGYIQSGYIMGEWFDFKDKNGYFGVFQLEIINSNELKGLWLGHSKSIKQIRSDSLTCTRIKD